MLRFNEIVSRDQDSKCFSFGLMKSKQDGWATDFFSHFDEGFLDEEFDLDFEELAKELLGGLNFSCGECGKLYRTDRGLNMHQLNKHNQWLRSG